MNLKRVPFLVGLSFAALLGGCEQASTLSESESVTESALTDCSVPDHDGDGFYSIECGGDDCDDDDANRFAGNVEICDEVGHDEDCDPTTVGRRDADGDGYVDAACWNAPATPSGSPVHGDDCDDGNPGAHPNAPETCDLADNDCDGNVDEGVITFQCTDADGDGYGAGTPAAVSACAPAGLPGMSPLCNDCDDTNAALHPGGQICADDESVRYCGPSGPTVADCDEPGQDLEFCLAQPSGAGVCVPRGKTKAPKGHGHVSE
ncbi:MAG TPA: putative metal-binding motif-containing protein [Kofleriaceae bacterium]|nr:putative metal-binding motif-containing protein [Kofleriaceae bacterium]